MAKPKKTSKKHIKNKTKKKCPMIKCFNEKPCLEWKYDKNGCQTCDCVLSELETIESTVQNMNHILDSIHKQNKINTQQEETIILKLADLKKVLITLCKQHKGKYNKKTNECHLKVSNLLTNINNTFHNYHDNYDNIILIGGGNQSALANKIPTNNYTIPKGVIGCQGGVNGCNNNQRLVYDSQGIIGCNQPFGVPSQGGQAFKYPQYIISK